MLAGALVDRRYFAENLRRLKTHAFRDSWRYIFECVTYSVFSGGSVAEWLACWTHAQKGSGSNRSRDAVG